MTLDCNGKGVEHVSTPLIAVLADDDLAARRIESVLNTDGLLISARMHRTAELCAFEGDGPDLLIVGCGRGITERDQQMRRVRRRRCLWRSCPRIRAAACAARSRPAPTVSSSKPSSRARCRSPCVP
jgi:hypothetical protein